MKSIKEWRMDNEVLSRNLTELNLMASFRNFAGGSNVKEDPRIKAGLKTKILSLWKDAQEAGMSALDFVRQVWAVAGSLATGKAGSNLNVANAARTLSAPTQQKEWEELGDLIIR